MGTRGFGTTETGETGAENEAQWGRAQLARASPWVQIPVPQTNKQKEEERKEILKLQVRDRIRNNQKPVLLYTRDFNGCLSILQIPNWCGLVHAP